MKIKIFLFIYLLLLFLNVDSQWETTNRLTSNRLNSIYRINDSSIWAVGSNAMIMHYDGEKWSKISLPYYAQFELRDVFFLNENNGWFCSDDLLLKYQNGDIINYKIGDYAYFYTLYFINDSDGWAGSNDGIYHFDGIKWEKETMPYSYITIFDMVFLNKINGWAVGTYNGQQIILKYNGTQWTIAKTLSTGVLYSIYMKNENEGYVIGNYKIYKYDGSDWTEQVSQADEPFNKVVGFNDSIVLLSSWGSVFFRYNNELKKDTTLDNYGLSDLVILADKSIIAVSGSGNIFYKKGSSWRSEYEVYDNLKKICVVNKNNQWLLSNNAVYKYVDNQWKVDTSFNYTYLNNMFFLDSLNGWVAGWDARYWKYNGNKWEEKWLSDSHKNYGIFNLFFTDTSSGWAVGYNGLILKYSNGKWEELQKLTNSTLYSVYFVDKNNGWAVGDSGVILQFKNNKWTNVSSITNKNLRSVYFNNINEGWAVGENNIILHYINDKWLVYRTSKEYSYYTQVIFNDKYGWIIASDGSVLRKVGNDWENVNSINSNFYFVSIAFVDSLNGWAVSNNQVFKTHSGGLYENNNSISLLGEYNSYLCLNFDTIKILGDVSFNKSITFNTRVKKVEFHGNYYLSARKGIKIIGTPEKPIIFDVSDTVLNGSHSRWGSINVNGWNTTDSCIIKYCKFFNSTSILNINKLPFVISNNTFYDYTGGIQINQVNSGIFNNNRIDSFTSMYSYPLSISYCNNININNNSFTRNDRGISINSSSNINLRNDTLSYFHDIVCYITKSNVNFNNSFMCNNKNGIFIEDGRVNINNCLIANNYYYYKWDKFTDKYYEGVIFALNSKVNILNSNIVNNINNYSWTKSAALMFQSSSGDIYNSIIWNNGTNDSSSMYIYNTASRPNFYKCDIEGGYAGIKLNDSTTYLGEFKDNISGIPLFKNPTIGKGFGYGSDYNALLADWTLLAGSSLINNGTENIGKFVFSDVDLKGSPRIMNGIVDIGAYENKVPPIEILGCDTIKEPTIWAADTVRIKGCNIVIDKNGILDIKAGTRVEFWGPYKIIVKGSIKAIGKPNEPVLFTIADTVGFSNNNVGWLGIEFDNTTGIIQDSSVFHHCIFEFNKDTIDNDWRGIQMKGLIKSRYFSKLRITNCEFRNNYSDLSIWQPKGLIVLYSVDNVLIRNNKFHNNIGVLLSLDNSSIKFSDNIISYNSTSTNYQTLFQFYYSNYVFTNNIVANNRVAKDNNIIDVNYSNSVITNNLFVNNLDTTSGYSSVLRAYGGSCLLNNNTFSNNKGFYCVSFSVIGITACNNIFWDSTYVDLYSINENSKIAKNIFRNNLLYYLSNEILENSFNNVAPCFVNPSKGAGYYYDGLNANWTITNQSPCINNGVKDTVGLLIGKYDLNGNNRVNGDIVDIGAYEHQGSRVTFTTQPIGGRYCYGDSISLTATISDSALIKWQKDGVDITNANGLTLSLRDLTEEKSGNYVCVAQNAYGTVYSNPAFIQVSNPPEIISQPNSQWLNENENDKIEVTVTGTKPLKYYWYYYYGLVDSTNSGVLNIENASISKEGLYHCVVKNYCGAVETKPFGVYLKPSLCLVTADKTSGKNVVIWERKAGSRIIGFNVYRESVVRDIYEKIGYVNFEDYGVFEDATSVPESRQYLYKIAAVTTEGEVSPLSPYHKTLFLQYVNSIEGVNLIWQPYEIENGTVEFKSYVLYKGTDSLNLQPFDTVSSSLNAYTDKDPNALTRLTYYRIGGLLYNPCNSQILLKAGGGPFVEALSNIEDNRLRSGNGIGSVAFANIIVYPQPAKDFVNISFNIKKQKEIRILLTDLMGKTIDYINFNDITLGNKTIRINFDKYNFKSGIYILKFLSDNEQQLIKLNIIR